MGVVDMDDRKHSAWVYGYECVHLFVPRFMGMNVCSFLLFVPGFMGMNVCSLCLGLWVWMCAQNIACLVRIDSTCAFGGIFLNLTCTCIE